MANKEWRTKERQMEEDMEMHGLLLLLALPVRCVAMCCKFEQNIDASK